MANSTCTKCEGTHFEVRENSPRNSNYKVMFVQCSSCGGVVGVLEYYNSGAKIEELNKKIDQSLMNSTSNINRNLDVINKNILNVIKLLNVRK